MPESAAVNKGPEPNTGRISPYLKSASFPTTAQIHGRSVTRHCQGAGSKKTIQVDECEATHKLIKELDHARYQVRKMQEQNAELQGELRMLFLQNQEMRRQLLKDDHGLQELRLLRIRIKELEC